MAVRAEVSKTNEVDGNLQGIPETFSASILPQNYIPGSALAPRRQP